MELDFSGVIKFWKNVQESLILIVDLLDERHLLMIYLQEGRTIAGIISHISAAYHWWLEYVVNDGKNVEPPEKEATTKKDLQERLKQSFERMDEYLELLNPDKYYRNFDVKEDDKTVKISFMWILMHLIEHDIHHRSQISAVLKRNNIFLDPKVFWNQPVL